MVSPNPKWRGDPTFLPEVLKAFGLEVDTVDGWLNRGHGDFGAIKGIIVHHIGSNSYGPSGIAWHPTLGLCSQIHLSRKGKVTLCGVGIAWHAGKGWYKGWPTNNANAVSIGIEPEGDGVSPWPPEQLDAYYRVCAAILWFLGKRATPQTLLAHWEYSRAAQGKWDPGAGVGRYGAVMDMNEFRRKVNAYIDNPPFAAKAKPAVAAKSKGDSGLDFDKIERRYTSRVTGSKVTMRPMDALMNADAHAFVARSNTEVLKDEIKVLRDDVRRLTELVGLLKEDK